MLFNLLFLYTQSSLVYFDLGLPDGLHIQMHLEEQTECRKLPLLVQQACFSKLGT